MLVILICPVSRDKHNDSDLLLKKASDFFRAYTGNIDSGRLFIKTTKNKIEVRRVLIMVRYFQLLAVESNPNFAEQWR